MKLTIAKSAGYCFGVKRAVNMVYQEAEEAKVPVYTYGPIIHNEEVVRGITIQNSNDFFCSKQFV